MKNCFVFILYCGFLYGKLLWSMHMKNWRVLIRDRLVLRSYDQSSRIGVQYWIYVICVGTGACALLLRNAMQIVYLQLRPHTNFNGTRKTQKTIMLDVSSMTRLIEGTSVTARRWDQCGKDRLRKPTTVKATKSRKNDSISWWASWIACFSLHEVQFLQLTQNYIVR